LLRTDSTAPPQSRHPAGQWHEVGHNHQKSEWTWDCLGEVSVNFFSIAAG
jgi:hypothetical protein